MKNQPLDLLILLLLAFVGISGAFSVLFGAWLAHAGQALPLDVLSRLTSAHQYQFLHTLALLAVILWYQHSPIIGLKLAAVGFALGIIFFSVSLYLKTFLGLDELSKFAPVGGMIFAAAWLSITATSVYFFKNKHVMSNR